MEDEAAFLDAYDPKAYAPVAVTVDIAVLTIHQGRLAVLLIERGAHPFKGSWALPGGFVDASEDLEAAALRELSEECGAKVARKAHLEQLGTFGSPKRDPRMRVISVTYVAFVPDIPELEAGSDAMAARLWAVEDLEGMDAPRLAFDHASILAAAIERTRSKLEYTTLAASFVAEPFTIGDLRRVYEAVWQAEVEPNNFRRKVIGTEGFLEPVGEVVHGAGRPAPLYRRGKAQFLRPPLLRPEEEGADTGARR